MTTTIPDPDVNNEWRTETPGADGWLRSPRPGAEDKFFPVKWAQEMADSFSDGRLTVVDGAGLFAHEERPAEVAAALRPLLIGDR